MSQPFALIQFQTHQIMNKYERMAIQIDGDRVGDIGNYDDLQIHVTPGTHMITSQGKWSSKAYPLYLTVAEEEEIEITIQPVNGKYQYQFVIDTKIPVELPEFQFKSNTKQLAWDLDKKIYPELNTQSQLTFDFKNSAFPDPLHFVIDLLHRRLAVFSSYKKANLLYEATYNRINSLVYPFSMLDNIIEHTFYRADGSLLGFLSLEKGRWIIASSQQERIAEICGATYRGERLYSQDNFLMAIQNDVDTLAHYINVEDSALRFEQFSTPNKDFHEILLLAFVSFSALSRVMPAEYTPQKVLDII